MNLRGISDTSIIVSIYRYFYIWYGRLEQKVSCLYCNSQTYRFVNGFWEKIKICFRYSFLGRITETRQATPVILDDSWTVQYLTNFYKRWKGKIIHYLSISLVAELAKNTKEQLNFFPVRIISMIAVNAITVNVILSFVLQRQIGLWGWLMRGLFLFAGALGLSCQADWQSITQSSYFLKWIKKQRF